eukprot:3414973-Pyramimonas_sp.AAC.1
MAADVTLEHPTAAKILEVAANALAGTIRKVCKKPLAWPSALKHPPGVRPGATKRGALARNRRGAWRCRWAAFPDLPRILC